MSDPKEEDYVAISPLSGIRVPLNEIFLGERTLESVIDDLRACGWEVVKEEELDA